jgi:hypothetical protein
MTTEPILMGNKYSPGCAVRKQSASHNTPNRRNGQSGPIAGAAQTKTAHRQQSAICRRPGFAGKSADNGRSAQYDLHSARRRWSRARPAHQEERTA